MKALACTCGDCLHWEIRNDGKQPLVGGRNFIGMPWHQPVMLVCKTCGHEFHGEFGIDPHEKLTEVEVTHA